MSYNIDAPDQGEVDAAAQAFVKDYLRGRDKDRGAAKKLLLAQVVNRHDPRSKAIRLILEAK